MEIVLRASVSFLFLWILLRALGKREVAEMTAFELVLVIVMGDLVQQGITQEDFSVTGALLAIGTIGLWILATSYVSFRFDRTRTVLEGLPTLVVRDGRFVREALRIERIDEDEVMTAAREQGIASIAQIRIGLLESGGRFSFLRYQEDDERRPPQESHPET